MSLSKPVFTADRSLPVKQVIQKNKLFSRGDVLNTASRIQAECNHLKKTFLVSEDVLKKINLPGEYVPESLGDFILRGKAQEVKLFSIRKI